MPLPSLASVHRAGATDAVAQNYRNNVYVGDMVFPIVPVKHESDYYKEWDQDDLMRSSASKVRPGTRLPRMGMALSDTLYTAEEYGIAVPIPRRIAENADDGVALDVEATETAMDQVLLAREAAIMAIVTASSWSGATTVAAGDNWDTGGGDPIGNVDTQVKGVKSKVGADSICGLTSWETRLALIRHPAIREYFGMTAPAAGLPNVYGPGGQITDDQLAGVLGLKKLYICSANYCSTKEGASTQTFLPVLGDYFFVFYRPDAPSRTRPSAGYTFRYKAPWTKTYFEDAEDQDVYEARETYVPKATCLPAGALISGTLA
jgi:hypothetical protein